MRTTAVVVCDGSVWRVQGARNCKHYSAYYRGPTPRINILWLARSVDGHSQYHTAHCCCISRCAYIRTYVRSVATGCISTICAHIYNLCSLLPLHLLFTPSCTHTNTHMYTCTYTHYTHKHSPTYIHTTCTSTNPHPHTRIHVLYVRTYVCTYV